MECLGLFHGPRHRGAGGRLYTSLANARAFAAGNKRTAYQATVRFIEGNGYIFDPPPPHAIDRLLGYFDGRLGQSGVVEWLRWWMTKN